MRRTLTAALAMVFAVLLMTTPAAAQSGQLVVASAHSSASDFQGGALDDVGVLDDDVVYRTGNPEPTTRYRLNGSFDDAFGANDATTSGGLSYGTPAVEGQAAVFDGTDDYATIPTSAFNREGGAWSMSVRADFSSLSGSDNRIFNSENSSGDEFRYFNDFWIVDSDEDQVNAEIGPFPDNEWVRVSYSWEYVSANDTTVIRGYLNDNLRTTKRLSGKIASPDEINVGVWKSSGDHFPGRIDEIALFDQRPTKYEIQTMATVPTLPSLDDTGQYISPDHSVENSHGGYADLTLENASAQVTWEGWTGSSWTTLASSSYSSTGNYSQTWSQFSGSEVRADVEFSNESGATTARLHSEGVFIETAPPEIDESTRSPDGLLDQRPQTISVDVGDHNFPFDEVDVTVDVDGQQVGTDTLGANGTASVDISDDSFEGGDHTVTVSVEDRYGLTDSASWTFSAPTTLQIRDESNPTQLVDNATVGVTFYYEDGSGQIQSVTRSTSDGTLNLTGLPVDKPLVASAQADGYRDRRVFLSSVYEQANVYLLPNSTEFTRTVFQLQDYSGQFPQETTVLQVSRSLNGTYRTVFGDYFGANSQFPAQLAYNERHRLRLVNTETGATRPLGTYTPLSSGEQTLSVSIAGEIEVLEGGPVFSAKPLATNLPAQNLSVDISLQSGDADITSFEVTAYLINNGTNTTLFTESYSGEQEVSRDVNLTAASGGTLKLVYTAETADGMTYREVKNYRIVSHDDNPATVIGGFEALIGLLPEGDQSAFTTTLGILITVVVTAGVGSTARLSVEMMGAVSVLTLTGVSIMGWVGYELLFVALVLWGSITMMRRTV